MANISSIACVIAVEMMEDTLTVGSAPGPAVPINPMTNIFIVGQARPPNPLYVGKMNEVALWFAVAPVANGAYVHGTQPMSSHQPNSLPERYASTDEGEANDWTIDYIGNFIRVSTGASMLGEVNKWEFENDPERPSKAQFPSYVSVVKMNPNKPVLLIILPLTILGCGALLFVWNINMHRSMAIPIMRNATLGEIIKSSQTTDIAEAAKLDQQDATKPSGLDKLEVRFKEGDTALWGLYYDKERS